MGEVNFEYTAEPPAKKSKLSSAKAPRINIDPHERKMINRVLNNIKLSRDTWNALAVDIRKGEGKNTICKKYGIKSGYFKYIRKIITGK